MGHGRRQGLVAAAVGLLALTACSSSGAGSGSGSGSATPSASATGTTSAAVASPSATVTYKPADPLGEGAWAELGQVTVRSPAEQVVVDAYLRMDQVGLQAFNTRVLDETALNAVLEGEYLAGARTAIQWRRQQNLWTVGRSVLNVLSVDITGSSATLHVCNFDGTSEVGTSGRNVVQPPGSGAAFIVMNRRDGVWRASSSRKDPAKCDAVALMKTASARSTATATH